MLMAVPRFPGLDQTENGGFSMAADFFIGESLVGDGKRDRAYRSHHRLKCGHAGAAFTQALSRNSDGFHHPACGCRRRTWRAKPDTLLFNKVTIKGAKQAVQMFGPAQAAVARAVMDSVDDGTIRRTRPTTTSSGGRVHPLAGERRQEDLSTSTTRQ
jgi:formaldehyde-activating enzyme